MYLYILIKLSQAYIQNVTICVIRIIWVGFDICGCETADDVPPRTTSQADLTIVFFFLNLPPYNVLSVKTSNREYYEGYVHGEEFKK